jgi:hypothetical protein
MGRILKIIFNLAGKVLRAPDAKHMKELLRIRKGRIGGIHWRQMKWKPKLLKM